MRRHETDQILFHSLVDFLAKWYEQARAGNLSKLVELFPSKYNGNKYCLFEKWLDWLQLFDIR